MKKLIPALVCLFLVIPSQARTITVDDDGPANFNNIQAAIDDSNDGDIIEVQPGLYTGDGNKDIDFNGRAITIRSIDPNDRNTVAATIIDCEKAGRGFFFHNGEEHNSVIDGLTITNGDTYAGCGIYCRDSSPTINNCIITGNSAGNVGGGVSCSRGSLMMNNCTLSENTAVRSGGGICSTYSSLTLTNCTFSRNTAGSYGGAMNYSRTNAKLTNCTFLENSAGKEGGGIYSFFSSSTTLTNCILWGDTSADWPEISGRCTASYSIVQGGWPGMGNVDADPVFVDAAAGDYHLSPHSPCINSGDPHYTTTPQDTDMDGDPRVINGRVDIGADEFSVEGPVIEMSSRELEFLAEEGGPNPETKVLSILIRGSGTFSWNITEDCPWLEVNPTNGESTGEIEEVTLSVDISELTWGLYTCELTIAADDAVNSPQKAAVALYVSVEFNVPSEYETIQAAIDSAVVKGDTVIVAPGTYTGEGNRDIDFLGKAITVRSTDPNDPDIVAATIIDCNGTEGDEHRGFYFHSGEGPDSVLEGFTITNGYAFGAGIKFRVSSSPTISNCIIRGNVAAWDPHGFPGAFPNPGGGIYCSSFSSPTITNCLLMDNKASASGGAIWSYDSDALVRNCTIIGNRAEMGGAGIALFQDNMSIQNCVISGNSTFVPGRPVIGMSGGGIESVGSTPKISNCTLTGNSAAERGGGIYIKEGHVTLTNSLVWGNRAPEGSEIALREGPFGPTSFTISYSDIQGGQEGVYVYGDTTLFWGPANIDADPCFVDPGSWDPNSTPEDPNDDFWVEGDYHLLPWSACIDAGDPNYVPEPNETDLDGNPRVLDGDNDGNAVVDMGAYELFHAIEVPMKFTPQALNPGSKGKWVKAHFVLPEGFGVEDVDTNSPAKIIEPFYMESEYMNVFINENGLVEIEAAFGRAEFCGNGPAEGTIKVIGVLTSGQYFCGTDTIKIINNSFEYLAVLASHWLQTDCGAPDWCGGFDVDQDSVVNFVDFAMFDDCCIEFIEE